MGKKRILEEALIEAQELENAAIENAKERVIESFAPDFVSFFKESLDEAEEIDYDEESDDEEMMDETEHDVGKEPDPGRQGTDPAVDDSEESLPQHKKDINEADEEEESDDDVDVDIDIDTDDEEDEGEDEEPEASDEEEPEGGEDDEELEVPDDLFDDEDDESMEDEEDEGEVELSDDFEDDDEEVDLDIEDDDEEDIDIEDDDVESEDDVELDLDDEEEFEEGLYMKKEGEDFQKVTPAEYLQTRLGELEEENRQLSAALEAMTGQLEETHLFNAKLAHLNKLYMSGVFNANEKENIAERLDACDDIQEVKTVYKHIVNEVKDSNPLDNFNEMLKEVKAPKKAKTENIYESTEAIRMRRLAGLDD